MSRCLQHEVDHLDGVLFTDRMEAEDLALVEEALGKLGRQTRLSLKRR
ncbi:MAG: peptide deformylase [Lentisphaeria bacterium]|nr:peptide deformylase [Lentisphaeria bacterium]